MADTPARILQLVETFARNIEAYRSQQYNEAQLRREFIDPFFEVLDWDITNKQGFAPQYREVIHENSIKIAGETKAPDYCFRIGNDRKFFLEAKKPSVSIDTDPDPAYQLRRYAWSAKLPLSILTNFETFGVYDCQIRPKHTDRPTTARIMNLTYKEYLNKWDEIAGIFSKDAVLKGSFDKFAVSPKGKRGTTTVDAEFLAEIEKWRKTLAQIIALRNRSLSIREINFAVQQTIDRILFLRLCEDRGIESYGQLRVISSGDRNYPRLCEIFEKADQKYNSGLFHFSDEPGRAEPPDELTLKLIIDDRDLKWILHNLYYPQSPYEFSVLPAEILGNVYEQFLGKVIRLTPGHRAVVEEKPEVKKAGGVYYTPAYIVDYIVKNTVGKLCEGKTPKQIEKIKILDPACGSGSFLLGAYTYLLNHHLDWYTKNEPQNWLKKKNPPIYQVAFSSRGNADTTNLRHCEESTADDEAISNYRLTVSEKKRILLNNIFGVDIDSQAVEVTKLSLLLKVLEGENQQSLENQYRLFHERALPDLGNNIKCGNSLIGPDFYDNLDSSLRDPTKSGRGNLDDFRNRINAFDWQAEFPDIFNRQNPGFDAIIGNPPYGGAIEHEIREYIIKQYSTAEYQFDSFPLFIEKGLNLLRTGGLWSMIVPNTWTLNIRCPNTRKFVLGYSIKSVRHFNYKVFPKATVDTEIWIIAKDRFYPENLVTIEIVKKDGNVKSFSTPQSEWISDESDIFNICITPTQRSLCYRIMKGYPSIRIFAKVTQGCKPFQEGKGKPPQTSEVVKKKPFVSEENQGKDWRPLLAGKLMGRYCIKWNENYWIKFGAWLAEPRYSANYDATEKIIIRQTGDSLVATLDREKFIVRDNLYTILPTSGINCRFLLGIINSKLLNFVYSCINLERGEALAQVKAAHLRKLPIRAIDFDNPDDVAKHDKMVKLVDRMLDLHKQLAAAKVPDEKTKIQRQIDATDKQIDKLVYDLYGLNDDEIKIVEEHAGC